MAKQKKAPNFKAGQLVGTLSSDFDGYLDGTLPSGELFGWAYDKHAPSCRITVYFAIDGIMVGKTEAGQYREDLKAAQKNDGQCGFIFNRILPKTLYLLKPNCRIGAFFDAQLLHQLPHSPISLTEEVAAQLFLSSLEFEFDDFPVSEQKSALTRLLSSLAAHDESMDSLQAYRQALIVCRLLLQTGEQQWLHEQIKLDLIRRRSAQDLPVFELMLIRTLAGNPLDETAEPEWILLENCLYSQINTCGSEDRQALYQETIHDLVISHYKDCHLKLVSQDNANEFSYRFLYLLCVALTKLYGDYQLSGNIMEMMRRTGNLQDNILWLEQGAKINRMQEKNFEALQDLLAAVKAGSRSAWVFQETAVLLASVCEGRVNAFRQYLPEIMALFCTSFRYQPQYGGLLQQSADNVLRRFFQDSTGYTAQLAKQGGVSQALSERRKDIQILIDALDIQSRFTGIGCYQGTTARQTIQARRFRHILFIGSKSLWQCYMYRVEQKMEQASTLGYQTAYRDIDSLDDESWKTNMVYTDAVYICRVPAVYTIGKLIAYARQLYIPVIYDIDDFLFDERYFPAPLESYAGTIDATLHTHLTMDNPFFEYALHLADYITCSTPPLAEKITAVVGTDKPVTVHPNLLSPNLYLTARNASRFDKDNDVIEIFYGSATKAHKQVVYEVFGPALRQVLQRFPNVKFTAFGYFQLPEELEAYADRIEFREPTTNRNYYLQQLSYTDINIAALEVDPFTDCKSEIKWLEAAVYSIPSIVTPTAAYRAALTPEHNVLFAADSRQWLKQLIRLIESPELRLQIGNNARVYALEHFSPTVGAGILNRSLKAVIRPNTDGKAQKPRLLYVNVWFAPQAVGGATRVFESHVRYLMENYGNDYELQVLTSQLHPEHFTPYSVEQFYYGQVLVTRLNVPSRDWSETDDPDVYAFCLDFFLKQQIDLIHFHALPIMTASPVDAARKLAIPYVITLHDGWWLSKYMFLIDDTGALVNYREAFSKPEEPKRQQQLFDCLHDARALWAVSDQFRDIYRQAGLRQTQSNENGLDMFDVLPRTPSATGKVRIAHIGGMARHKGYHVFKDAVMQTKLKHIEVHIIDHSLTSGEYYQGQWGDTPVFFHPKCQQSEINSLYASTDVLVAPSIWPEAYGLVTREAAYAGIWVIASDRGAVGDCIEEGVNGRIVQVDDIQGLQKALLEIDSHPEQFLTSCPAKTPRRVAEQIAECITLYQSILTNS